jgi:hypothetical protein
VRVEGVLVGEDIQESEKKYVDLVQNRLEEDPRTSRTISSCMAGKILRSWRVDFDLAWAIRKDFQASAET